MIQSSLVFEVNTKMFDGNIAALKLSFLVDDLIEAKNKEIENNFAVFLYTLDTLKSYGMPVRTELLTFEKGTQITYYLCLSQLAAFAENIEKIIIFDLSKANKTQWEIDLFESTYEKDLKRFALNIREEIEKVYKK